MRKIRFSIRAYGNSKIEMIKDFRSAISAVGLPPISLSQSKAIVEAAMVGPAMVRVTPEQFGAIAAAAYSNDSFGSSFGLGSVVIEDNQADPFDLTQLPA